MKKLAPASVAMVVLAALAGTAVAQDDVAITKDTWPLAINDRPLTLVSGMLEIRGDTVRINLSSDAVGKPIAFLPAIYYGVNDKLTVGIYHPVNGICISGTSNGCAKAYNDIAIDALYGLMVKGSFLAAFHGGIAIPFFSPDLTAGLNLGLMAKLRAGKVAVVFDPRIYVGLLQRDTMKEQLAIPVWIQGQINGQTNVFLSSGIYGPLDGFGDFYSVPIGVGATFAVNNRLDFGGEFRFLNLAGKGSSADFRDLVVRLALRL